MWVSSLHDFRWKILAFDSSNDKTQCGTSEFRLNGVALTASGQELSMGVELRPDRGFCQGPQADSLAPTSYKWCRSTAVFHAAPNDSTSWEHHLHDHHHRSRSSKGQPLAWLADLGWSVAHGPDIAPDTPGAERDDYGEVVLGRRLRDTLAELNPRPARRCAGRCL